MIYAIPVFGWFIGLFFQICLAVPAYFFWNWTAPKYFYWLPPVYLNIPFWDMVFLIACISIVKAVLLPSFGSHQSNTNKANGK